MKKLLLIGSIILVLGLLIVSFTTPLFAHGPGGGEAIPAKEGTWEAMHEACEEGNWEAMAEACHGYYTSKEGTNRWGGVGGHMGSHMMGW